ncbi:SEL1-like repeat protein [Myxococcota bacterium]|nr:SEL1-like repeat protein [Myxococcota bacterium]MBU1379746.1 SEL1-like repeat protein [Myxococcota bacterium]MBU1498541.1 SEL1-like repeat protein [Myxococcota bacterium]
MKSGYFFLLVPLLTSCVFLQNNDLVVGGKKLSFSLDINFIHSEKGYLERGKHTYLCGNKNYSSCYKAGMSYAGGIDGTPVDLKKGMELLLKGCSGGNKKSCTEYAKKSSYLDFDENFQKIKNTLQTQCNNGNIYSCRVFAYSHKTDTIENFNVGIQLLKKLCDKGDIESCADYEQHVVKRAEFIKVKQSGYQFFSIEDIPTVVKLCKRGNPEFCNNLANFYFDATFREYDLKKSFILHKYSCEKGISTSCKVIGDFLIGGYFEDYDFSRSYKMYERACKMGSIRACISKNVSLYFGRGVNKERSKSFKKLDYFCSRGMNQACISMGWIYYWGNGVAKNHEMAIKLFKAGCDKGYSISCNNLASIYMKEKQADKEKLGFQYFQKSCKKGNMFACSMVAKSIVTGVGTEQNVFIAKTMLEKQCSYNNHHSCALLGLLYRTNASGKKDKNKAIPYLKKACHFMNDTGCTELASEILTGNYYFESISKAEKLLKRSCGSRHAPACFQYSYRKIKTAKTLSDYLHIKKYLDIGCEWGDGEAGQLSCATLAYFFENGVFGQKKLKWASTLYKIACKLGHKPSCQRSLVLEKHVNSLKLLGN